jgi:hypothetical protein
MKTTAGAFCFAEEKAKQSAGVITQVSGAGSWRTFVDNRE